MAPDARGALRSRRQKADTPKMTRAKRVVVVLAGYVLAMIASGGVVALYDRTFTAYDNQTMGGMIAGGEMILGAGVFFVASLLPTGLALWYLRRSRAFWSAFSFAGLAFAVLGLASASSVLGMRGSTGRMGFMDLVGLFGLAHMLGSPIWIGGFVVFAFLAPWPDLRRRMLMALAVEVLVAGCGVLQFMSTRPL